MNFSKEITKWYNKNKRDLPWRKTKDPYTIWLSEVILQQTRVDQGLPYFHKFIEKYPSIYNLSAATEDEVLKLWQGLGYYSRARNMHETAKFIVTNYNGKFPETYEEILSLKGIGTYSAAAIISFAFDKPYAVLDGNVFRVLSRYFGIQTPIDSTAGKKEFNTLANRVMDVKNHGIYNQAIMEFGARKCTPTNPECTTCALNKNCIARSENKVHLLPVKSKKVKQKNRYFNYLVIKHDKKTFIQKRGEKDIWKNLYEFPLIETPKVVTRKELMNSDELRKIIFKKNFDISVPDKEYKHILSHQKIYAKFWEINIEDRDIVENDLLYIDVNEIFTTYAVPKLIQNFLTNKFV